MARMVRFAAALVLLTAFSGCRQTPEDVAKWKAGGNVPKLVRALHAPAQDVRFAAIEALGDLEAEEAVEPLARLFADPDLGIVLRSIDSLDRIGTPAAQARLVDALGLDTARGRTAAAAALGRHRTPQAVDPLIAALDDPYELVAVAAATALSRIGDGRAVGALSAKMGARSQAMRLACTQALASIGGEETVEGLALVLGDINDEVRSSAVAALAEIGGPALETALGALRSEDALVRQSGRAILDAAGAVPGEGGDLAWYRLARIKGGKLLEADLALAGQLAGRGMEVVPALIEAAAHGEPAIRECAFRALEAIGEPCAAQATEAAMENAGAAARPWFAGRSGWCGAPSWRLDLWGAATALNPAFKPEEAAAAVLAKSNREARRLMLSDKFAPGRELVPLLIAQFAYRAPARELPAGEAVPGRNLVGADPKAQAEEHHRPAMRKLRAIPEMALFPLLAALHDPDGQVADLAAETLGGIGDERAVPDLVAALSRRVDGGGQLTDSPLYAALLGFQSAGAEPVLDKVRPGTKRATDLFERHFRGIRATGVRTRGAQAPHSEPITFFFGYLRDGRVREFEATFARDAEGNWRPEPPFPETLP